MSELCGECGRPKPQAHKESMDKTRLQMLQKAAQRVVDTGVNDFKKKDLGLAEFGQSAYGNFTRLRYHGLITPVRDQNKKRIKGRWLITRNGWAFLRGEFQIHKYVLVKNNEITSRSDERIGLRDVWFGAEIMQTTFEYFDDDGRMVGVRPIAPQTRMQPSLF